MTDHKAEWVLVPRVATPEMIGAFRADAGSATMLTHTSLRCTDFDSRYSAMIAAAPAASEGEDGAVAWQYRYRNQGPNAHVYNTFVHPLKGRQDGGAEIEWWVYGVKPSRPAAQVAATPKHDEGRSAYAILTEYAAAIGDDHDVGICNCDILRARDALATQPAAVTDECGRPMTYWGGKSATQPAARRMTDEKAAFEAWLDRERPLWRNNPDSIAVASMRIAWNAALESFAQPQSVPDEGNAGVPAEGVSDG